MARLLSKKFSVYMDSARDLIKKNSTGSLTTDLWTFSCYYAYMGVTYHTISEEWELVSKVLALRHFPIQHHTAENIRTGSKQFTLECIRRRNEKGR
uniref:Uncharacterized protein n=1 Tax=Romanomermis culicivorax TaxID=13658 RepID=A0A915K216_ROMCU